MWVDSEKTDVPLLNTGIAWESDRKIKFRNPPGDLKEAFQGKFAKPKAWRVPVYELDTDNPDNNGFQNEDLIVWMRTAAFPTFRKLYRRIDHSQKGFVNGLRKGDYELKVEYGKYILFSIAFTSEILLKFKLITNLTVEKEFVIAKVLNIH